MVIAQPVLPVCSGCRAQGGVLEQPLTSCSLSPVWRSDTVRTEVQGVLLLEAGTAMPSCHKPSTGAEIPFPSAFLGEAKWLRSKSWAVFVGECGDLTRSAGALIVTQVSCPSPPDFVSVGVDGVPSRTLQQ